jgi:hypothetical protein
MRDAELQRMMPDWVPFAPNKWWIHVRTVGESDRRWVRSLHLAVLTD